MMDVQDLSIIIIVVIVIVIIIIPLHLLLLPPHLSLPTVLQCQKARGAGDFLVKLFFIVLIADCMYCSQSMCIYKS